MAGELREVYFVDGCRTAFGRADRMCAGALTAATAAAGEIAMGTADVVLAGGVEHMGHHPFRAGGRVTAGNSAGLADGASACLLASEDAADELGLEPRMRLAGFAYAGVEPELMGLGPVPATLRVLERAGLTLDDVDLFEPNEPFADHVLSWCDRLGIDPRDERLNPYGGAIACGRPPAATGGRLLAQPAYGLGARPASRCGLAALCVGTGMGAALLFERV